MATIDMFDRNPIDMAFANYQHFSGEFLQWIQDNVHVFHAFAEQVFLVRNKGFKHYSSKTIIEVLRHHSALSDSGVVYKLNNNVTPYLPRLFDLMHPKCAGMFEYRVTSKGKFDGSVL
ncbi:MAG: hypothetical protein ACRC1W_12855 [Shewanella sp.]